MKVGFFCVQRAAQGGQTPIADSRQVYQRIAADIRDEFARKGVMYVRNYGEGLDLSWQEVFQTNEKSAVEHFCRQYDIAFSWSEGERLTTKQVCQAVSLHPVTGDKVWFNQAHLFHVSSLAAEIRASLLSTCSEEQLPRNAFYGDGSKIDDSVLEQIRACYRQGTIEFDWQNGDILILDNMLTAHGRNPYTGFRKIVVGMAEQFGSAPVF
jgi:alpha-ketoglutarate-dependent taurine dioxygenase